MEKPSEKPSKPFGKALGSLSKRLWEAFRKGFGKPFEKASGSLSKRLWEAVRKGFGKPFEKALGSLSERLWEAFRKSIKKDVRYAKFYFKNLIQTPPKNNLFLGVQKIRRSIYEVARIRRFSLYIAKSDIILSERKN